MTVLFKRIRTMYLATLFVFTAAVLGISAYFAQLYLPNQKHGGFVIYAIVIPALTIVFGLIQLFWAQPRTEVVFLFVAGVLWLTQAAWATDQSTNAECFALGNSQTQTQHGLVSSKSICYETKVVEAFSWTIFLALAIAFIITITLASQSKVLGHPEIWSEPIDNLPWFGELPGYPGQRWFGSDFHRFHHRFGYGGTAPVPMAQPGGAIVNIGGQSYHQKAGHSLVIRPDPNGGPPQVSQVEGYYQPA
ncbi:hypothetical protein PENSPDRAFT_497824 [Peniophora sp. CONT]|nr:hypothetical protein PENSPDRAFT_497824 [Peniophora sp. CONT]